MSPIDFSADVLDSIEIEERIEHLSQLEQPGPVDLGDEDAETDQDTLFAELRALRSLRDDLEGYCEDWRHGCALINADHFREYAEQTACDIHGRALTAADWPFNYIDWDRAADALQDNYTSADVTVDGTTYTFWAR